jgi:septal ring-binding cell division protein DamX
LKLKPINIFLLGTAIIYLSACTIFDDSSGAASREQYLGWYCQADVNAADQWHCSERLMSGALPIDKVLQRDDKVPQRDEKMPQPDKKVPEDNVPPPMAKNQFAEKRLFEQAPEKTVEQVVEPTSDASFHNSLDTNFDISADGYTVQLGAFISRSLAERSAGNIITEDGPLIVHNIIVSGQYRFVIVCGQYPTRQQAQTVAERFTALNPQLEYWVRSIKSLRNSL